MSLNQINSSQTRSWLNVSFNSLKSNTLSLANLGTGILKVHNGSVGTGVVTISDMPRAPSGILKSNKTYSRVNITELIGGADGIFKNIGGVLQEVDQSTVGSTFLTVVKTPHLIINDGSTINQYSHIKGIQRVTNTYTSGSQSINILATAVGARTLFLLESVSFVTTSLETVSFPGIGAEMSPLSAITQSILCKFPDGVVGNIMIGINAAGGIEFGQISPLYNAPEPFDMSGTYYVYPQIIEFINNS
jgi:hypothetical protein